MTKLNLTFFMSFGLIIFSMGQVQHKFTQNESFTYDALIKSYKMLDDKYPEARIMEQGSSDEGTLIYLFVIDFGKVFMRDRARKTRKTILLINNGIHAGEPCGVDASLKFAEEVLSDQIYRKYLENTVVCIIPAYNIGGMLNRSCCSRVGQNGPEEYGFRGNALNLDLNRDFIKTDSKNMKIFAKIFHAWDPDVFIDTHTTNGSEHQYTMTLIASQKNKLDENLAELLQTKLSPFLYETMKKKDAEMTPYVYGIKESPDLGIKDFLETPRYSTGYAALFNTIGFVTEALKYKSFEKRVTQTLKFEETMLEWMSKNNEELRLYRSMAVNNTLKKKSFDIYWVLDTSTVDSLEFKGYKANKISSSFGENTTRIQYDLKSPYEKRIPYYSTYKAVIKVNKPKAYIIPQTNSKILDLLRLNNVRLTKIKRDTSFEIEAYYIKDYKTVKMPYEGHYLHYDIKKESVRLTVDFHNGDYVVNTNQKSNRYIIECLEPDGHDSFLAWNYFDSYLEQKEWFSPFSFEKMAIEILKENRQIRTSFKTKKSTDTNFAKDRVAQLRYIYENSKYYEKTANLYPIYRLN